MNPDPVTLPMLFPSEDVEIADFVESTGPMPSYRLFAHSGEIGSPALMTAEFELREINDLCFIARQATEAQVEDMQRMVRGLQDGTIRMEDPEFGDLSGEVAEGKLSVGIPHWQSVAGEVADRAARLLLHDLVDRTLAELAQEFGSVPACANDPLDLVDLTIPEALDRTTCFLESLESSLPGTPNPLPRPEGAASRQPGTLAVPGSGRPRESAS